MGYFKRMAVVLLFLCAALSCGAGGRTVKTEITIDGDVYASEYALNKNIPFYERAFIFNPARYAARLRGKGLSDREIIETAFGKMIDDVESTCAKYRVKPSDATASFYPERTEKFEYCAETVGREIDVDKLCADIIAGLNLRTVRVEAKFNVLSPQVTEKELRANTVKRGSFKTGYGSSGAARKENVARAASFINGTRIKPNEIFSFNKTVGARTAARGYKEAPIIVDGKFRGGVGGGVCQVSTTLYNAVLRAGLSVATVNRHSLPVKYVAPSFDAMVSSVSDFRFVNDTGYDIFIGAKCADGTIEITLYGEQKDYEIRLESEKVKVIERAVEYVFDETLTEGEEKVLAEGADGLVSRGYIVKIYKDGTTERREIRRDTYRAQTKTIAFCPKNDTEKPDGEIN